MVHLIIWILMSYGLSTIIVYGSIFEPLRNRIETIGKNGNKFFLFISNLISCMLCTSTWVGFFISVIFGGFITKFFDVNYFLGIFFDGMFTAGSVWALNSIIEFFEEKQ